MMSNAGSLRIFQGGGIGALGSINEGDFPLRYVPDLGSVGSGASYFPRSVDDDAVALNALGFQAGFPGGGRSKAQDMNEQSGAWDSTFRGAVTAFQQRNPAAGVADGWIGPNTRRALATAVDKFNLTNPGPNPLPMPKIAPAAPAPGGPASPAPGVVVPVADADGGDETMMYVAIGGGVLVAAGLLYWALS